MSPKAASIIAEAAQCLKRVLQENEEKAYGLHPLLIGDITKNYNAARGLVLKAQNAAKEKADELLSLLRKTEGPDEQGELDFEALAANDVPGQQKLANEWKAAASDPDVIRDLILMAVADGSGRTEVLEMLRSKVSISKFEAETLWDDLVRDGALKKVKGKFTVVAQVAQDMAPDQAA